MWRRRWFRWAIASLGWTCVALFLREPDISLLQVFGRRGALENRPQDQPVPVVRLGIARTGNHLAGSAISPRSRALGKQPRNTFSGGRGRRTGEMAVGQSGAALRAGVRTRTSLIFVFHQSLVTYWLLVGARRPISIISATAKVSAVGTARHTTCASAIAGSADAAPSAFSFQHAKRDFDAGAQGSGSGRPHDRAAERAAAADAGEHRRTGSAAGAGTGISGSAISRSSGRVLRTDWSYGWRLRRRLWTRSPHT